MIKIKMSDAMDILSHYHCYCNHAELVDNILEKYDLVGQLDDVVEAIVSKNSRICRFVGVHDEY